MVVSAATVVVVRAASIGAVAVAAAVVSSTVVVVSSIAEVWVLVGSSRTVAVVLRPALVVLGLQGPAATVETAVRATKRDL